MKKVDIIVNLFNFVKKIKNFSKNETYMKFFGLLFIDTIKADYNIGVKIFKNYTFTLKTLHAQKSLVKSCSLKQSQKYKPFSIL